MYEYDYQGGAKKHESPTKRLIKQKNVITAHKQKFKGAYEPAEYQLSFNTGMDKSYII